jgi:diguanylate cyclase (GGDEF)-like protein/PAS domain S-box-containing protein
MHTPPKDSHAPHSPAVIFLVVALSVFISETIVMLLLHVLPQQSFLVEAAIDASLLVCLIAPMLYYFLFLPMTSHILGRQRVEDTLLKNKEQQFKSMIRASLDGFWITDTRGRFTEVNNAYCQMTGYSQAELLGMSVSDVEAIESPEDTAKHIRKLLETGSDHFETRHRNKSGLIMDLEVSANYSHLNGGMIYSFLRDITARKHAEEKLKLSEQILNRITDSVFLIDLDGNFVYMNEAAWKSRGYTQEEMFGMNLRTLNTPEYNQLIELRMNELLEKGQASYEAAHYCKDGSIMQVEINARITETGGQKLLLAVVRDITERNLMENALLESEEKFRSMSNHTQDALIMMDEAGNISFWNAAAEKIFGYSTAEVLGKELHTFIAPAIYYDAFKKAFGHFRDTGEGAMVGKTRELVALRKGGIEFPVELALASLKLRNKWYAVGIARDISARKSAEEALRESESRLVDMFENLSSGVAIYHASSDLHDFTITAFNTAAERIDSIRREDLIGKSVLEVFPGITEFGLLDVFRRVWKSGVAEHFPITFYQDGRINGWRENYVYKLPNGEIVAIFDDVTKEKQADERIHYLAHYDALTGLPNRSLFADRLQQAISKAKREKTRVALMFIDLDKFKPVNDDLGHNVGDMLLMEVAKRMQNCVRESDTVSRIGGDEFVIMLPSIEAEQHAMLVAEKILYAINQIFELDGHRINISSSIGIAVYPEHGGDEKLLTKNADIAMYNAKNGGRNNVKLYRPDMKAA